ncbi:MAG TPA: ABC transporter substrate-binding protein [Mycobacteriales bacterium]|nr:ABC transporter substrate-binding protein [Mycobacteriales bacterium]
MNRSTRPGVYATALVCTLTLVAACGGGSSGGKQAVQPTSSVDSAAAGKVPSAIKSAGVVKVATDASYPPDEFFASDNKTIQGLDVDLGEAIGGVLGLKFEFVNVGFDSIIPSLGSRYDLGMSSFTDSKEREKTVDMVDYANVGTNVLVPKDSSLNPTSVADLCGKTAAVEKGTVQLDMLQAQAKKCTLHILPFPDENQANLALKSGRADAVLADVPVNVYTAQQSNGAFKVVGGSIDPAPYGIAVPKGAKYQGLADAIQAALKVLKSNGTYDAIFKKWSMSPTGISDFTLNGAVS